MLDFTTLKSLVAFHSYHSGFSSFLGPTYQPCMCPLESWETQLDKPGPVPEIRYCQAQPTNWVCSELTFQPDQQNRTRSAPPVLPFGH
jgi:hypothetical protein